MWSIKFQNINFTEEEIFTKYCDILIEFLNEYMDIKPLQETNLTGERQYKIVVICEGIYLLLKEKIFTYKELKRKIFEEKEIIVTIKDMKRIYHEVEKKRSVER